MLVDCEILPERRAEIVGVVHINGTARIQTLRQRKDNPFLFDLLAHMKRHYGIRSLINTSFNYQGEPIVHTIEDAYHSARRMRLDAVVLNGQLRVLSEDGRQCKAVLGNP
jgi:carbamoyltransferase